MQEGDVVIVAMPQADGVVKDRPAIILRQMPPFGDMLICGVSTQLRHAVKGFDEIIAPADADFVASGLNAGSIASERHKRLLARLSDYLTA